MGFMYTLVYSLGGFRPGVKKTTSMVGLGFGLMLLSYTVAAIHFAVVVPRPDNPTPWMLATLCVMGAAIGLSVAGACWVSRRSKRTGVRRYLLHDA